MIDDFRRAVAEAEARIGAHVRSTPVESSPMLAGPRRDAPRVHLKLECQQVTGSFKLRGALNKMLSLSSGELEHGVVAASAGNHGRAVAHGARLLDCDCEVFVPNSTAPDRVRAIEALGARVVRSGDDCVETEATARAAAAARGCAYVSPYNDPLVVAGQGTIAAELDRQLDAIDAVYVALGGGGLAAGIAGYLDAVRPDVEIVACSPENSRVMHESVRAGRILDLRSEPTLSDSTAGGVEPDTITFEPCRWLIDRFVLVSEAEIAAAMRSVLEHHHTLIEGAAGVAVAGFCHDRERHSDRDVVVVLCGANVGIEQLRSVLAT